MKIVTTPLLTLFLVLVPSLSFAQADAAVLDAAVMDAAVLDAAVMEDAEVTDAIVVTPTQDAEVAAPLPQPPEKIETVEDAAAAVDFLLAAAQGGAWPLFTGVLIMLVIWLMDRLVKLKSRVSKRAVPWVAAILGIAGSMATALISDSLPLSQALIQGFLGGAASVGLWELFFQKEKPQEG